jgi:hypothetical protein
MQKSYQEMGGNGVACGGVVELGCHAAAAAGVTDDDDYEPALALGTMQLEESLLVFDLDKGVLRFSGPLPWSDLFEYGVVVQLICV